MYVSQIITWISMEVKHAKFLIFDKRNLMDYLTFKVLEY